MRVAQFPNRLNDLLDREDLKPYELASQLGVSPSTVDRWRRGEPIPDGRKAAIAEYFEVSIAHLMHWDEEPEAPEEAAA